MTSEQEELKKQVSQRLEAYIWFLNDIVKSDGASKESKEKASIELQFYTPLKAKIDERS